MWGVFEYDKGIHIIPCSQNGIINDEHKVDELCFCEPEIIKIDSHKRWLVNHKQVQ